MKSIDRRLGANRQFRGSDKVFLIYCRRRRKETLTSSFRACPQNSHVPNTADQSESPYVVSYNGLRIDLSLALSADEVRVVRDGNSRLPVPGRFTNSLLVCRCTCRPDRVRQSWFHGGPKDAVQ